MKPTAGTGPAYPSGVEAKASGSLPASASYGTCRPLEVTCQQADTASCTTHSCPSERDLAASSCHQRVVATKLVTTLPAARHQRVVATKLVSISQKPQPSKKRDLEEPWLANLQGFPLTDWPDNSLKKAAYTLPVFVVAHCSCNPGDVQCWVETNTTRGPRGDAKPRACKSAIARVQERKHSRRQRGTTGAQALNRSHDALVAPSLTFGVLVTPSTPADPK